MREETKASGHSTEVAWQAMAEQLAALGEMQLVQYAEASAVHTQR
jgi:hypothetical protein